MKKFHNLTSEGQKYPPEVRVQHETCSTISGTPGTFGSFQWEMCKNALFWPSLTPPANPVKFFWSKMACTCVPHIVLHVSCRTCTSGGYFRPSEVRFRAKIPLSSHWFYNVKTQRTQFLQNSQWEMAEIENIHCPICTQPIPSSWQNALGDQRATGCNGRLL